jgi:hypothetical protein
MMRSRWLRVSVHAVDYDLIWQGGLVLQIKKIQIGGKVNLSRREREEKNRTRKKKPNIGLWLDP